MTKPTLRLALVGAAAVLLASGPCEAKHVSGVFHLESGDLTHGPEYEVAKFSFAVGHSKIEGVFKFADSHTWMTSPALYLFRDEVWDQYHSAPACDDKMMHAHKAIPIGLVTRSHTDVIRRKVDEKGTKTSQSVLPDGRISWSFSWEFETEERTHGWFLVAADCALEQFNARVSPMEYSINLLNPGNTHLPADEFGLPRFYLAVFLGLCAFGVWGIYLVRQNIQETGGKVHLVVWLLFLAYALQVLSIACELVHLWVYRDNGEGFFIFDLFSELYDGASQLVVSFVLICLGSGWTLVEYQDDATRTNSVGSLLRHPGNMCKGANVVIVAVIAIAMATTTLQLLNKLGGEDFTKFHDYESRAGYALVAVHLFLGVGFVFSLVATLRVQQSRGGSEKLILFLRRLLVLGALWFLIFPVLVAVASVLAHYNRHRFVSSGVLIVQTICLALMMYQFTASHSTYFKLSALANVGVLPGAGGFIKPTKLSRD